MGLFKHHQTNVLKMQAVCSLFRTCVVEQMGTRHWGAFKISWLIKLKFYEHFADLLLAVLRRLQCNCFVMADINVGHTHSSH